MDDEFVFTSRTPKQVIEQIPLHGRMATIEIRVSETNKTIKTVSGKFDTRLLVSAFHNLPSNRYYTLFVYNHHVRQYVFPWTPQHVGVKVTPIRVKTSPSKAGNVLAQYSLMGIHLIKVPKKY